jgi:flagellar M-ring protein FliF
MEIFKKLSPVKLGALIGGGILLMSLLLYLAFKLAAPPMAILYANLSPEDSSLITSRLDGMGINYSISDGGKEVLAPISKVLMLRMTFAQEGIPKSGSIVGYEIFDKTDALGTSQFVHNVNLVRALEGELSRTIASLNLIESARVHLVLPKKELFSKGGVHPSASVVIRMKGSGTLSKSEVAAIGHLVANAVPQLKVEDVTIIDNNGKPLKLGYSEGSDISTVTDTATEYQKAVEEKLKDTIEDLLEKSVGLGKVKANVAAEINFDREVINSEIYDPDGQVVRSKKTSEETESESDANSGNVSVSTNVPGGQSGSAGAGGRNKNTSNEVTNYEISKTITNKITESGRIKRLSIAVLVDGIYQVDNKEAADPQAPVKYTYTPRADAEIEKLKLLAASAVGLDPKRGDRLEVINLQFSEEFINNGPTKESTFAWVESQLQNIIQTIVIGTVIILLILLVVRPVILRSLEMSKTASSEDMDMSPLIDTNLNFGDAMNPGMIAGQPMQSTNSSGMSMSGNMAPPPDIIDLTSMEDKRKGNLIKQVNEIVEKHPDETVNIIKNWLYSAE